MEKNNLIEKIESLLKTHPNQSAASEILERLIKAKDEDEEVDYSDSDESEGESDDAAEAWLKAQEGGSKTDKPKQSQARWRQWESSKNLTTKHEQAIKEHMANGYSEREAHRMAGAHKEAADLQSAMRSGLAPSRMSTKMIDELKGLASEWIGNARRHDKLNADIDKNPLKHASGKMMAAHEQATGDYTKAYNDFLNSDQVKSLSGRDRHQAVQKWKTDYKTKNPDHESKLANSSASQSIMGVAKDTMKSNLKDKMFHIMSGGASMPTDMSAQEAAQHVGGTKEEDGGYSANISHDPSASFASKNPHLVHLLSDEMKDRKQRVDSAAKTQQVIRRRPGGIKNGNE